MSERRSERNIDERLKRIEEQVKGLLNIISDMPEEGIKEEFSDIWKSIQELIFYINFTISDLDDKTKREYIEKISRMSIDLSQKVLAYISNKRLRYLIIHVFLDWILKEALRWGIELPKIKIPKPPPKSLPKPESERRRLSSIYKEIYESESQKIEEPLFEYIIFEYIKEIKKQNNIIREIMEILSKEELSKEKLRSGWYPVVSEEEKEYYTKKQSMITYKEYEKYLSDCEVCIND